MKTTLKKIGIVSLGLTLCFQNACTTLETKRIVLEEPMTQDTEKRVLKETGISGALTGGIAAGLIGGGLGFGYTLLIKKRPIEEAILVGAVTGIASAVAGGTIGYQKGKEAGQKLVAKSMERDQFNALLEGAKNYNNRLASINKQINQQIKNAKNDTPKIRKQVYQELSRLNNKEILTANKRLKYRTDALENSLWAKDQKGPYLATLKTLEKEVKEAQETKVKLQKLQDVVVTL